MTARPPSHRLLRSLPLLALAAAVATTACDVAAGTEAEASLTTEPPSASASLRVAVTAGLGAGEPTGATDTLPPLLPLPPLAPAAPAPPPPDDSTPLAPPPPDAPAPPALPAPPAPDRSVPPTLVAPPAPAPRPTSAAPPAPPAPAAPAAPLRIITDTMAATPDPSRPMPKASTGFEHAFPIRLVGRGREEMRVLDYLTVARVRPGTGAARAGIEAGDVILALNGMDAREFRNWVGLVTQEPGTRYSLRIRRGATVRDIAAVLDRPTEGKPLW